MLKLQFPCRNAIKLFEKILYLSAGVSWSLTWLYMKTPARHNKIALMRSVGNEKAAGK
jgi:hypothetical protein